MTNDEMDEILRMESEDTLARTFEPLPVNETRTTAVTRVNERLVAKGRELSFRGERGRFRFRSRRINEATGVDEIDVWGPIGRGRRPAFRTFRTERLRRVHNHA